MNENEQTSTNPTTRMPRNHGGATNAQQAEVKSPSAEEIINLGILFVHGIGAQRRGDTVAQCGAAIHGWLSEWMTQPLIAQGSFKVELLDTNLTQPRAEEPAHSRLIFRKEQALSEQSWLLAESCWSEAFRPPSYREFIRWAAWVFPLTCVLHVLSSFCRNDRVMRNTTMAIELLTKRSAAMSPESFLRTMNQLQSDLGPRYGPLPGGAALRKILSSEQFRASIRWSATPFQLASLLFVAFPLQVILLAVMVIGLLPIGFVRSGVLRAQKAIAAVLGDSYLFVASPISKSATVTQVKKDLEWLCNSLSKDSDQIVVLAHSQGAAVVYRAIEEWSWEGKVPKKLKLLITYGSGLQKLHALQELSRKQAPYKVRATKLGSVSAGLGSIGVMAAWLWIVGAIPFWLAALGFAAGFLLLLLALTFFRGAYEDVDPPLLLVKWANFFASNDPVSNGPTAVKPPQFRSTGNAALDSVYSRVSEQLVNFFHFAEREVVNLRSSIADHTGYWSAKDDFVSRVAVQLLRVSGISLPGAADSEWIEVAVQRRRWRVGLRTGCRKAAVLAALCVPFWPPGVIGALGKDAAELLAPRFKQWIPNWIPSIAVSDWSYGVGVLLIGTGVLFVIAMTGWNMWQRREFGHFFRREPFRAAGVGLYIFALGWLAVLALIPAVTALVVGGQALWPSLWTSSLLLAASGWAIAKSGQGPGRASTWIPTLLEEGEASLQQETGNRSENLARAQGYFSWAVKWLLDKGDSMLCVRGLLGIAQVLEQSEETNEDVRERIKACYQKALDSLERMGKDTGAVRERLNKLSVDVASAEPTQQHGASPPS